MLECALTAPTGDDVFSEDPTVLELEAYMANLFEKEKALFIYVYGRVGVFQTWEGFTRDRFVKVMLMLHFQWVIFGNVGGLIMMITFQRQKFCALRILIISWEELPSLHLIFPQWET
jgi:hypothetical protein